MLAKIFLLFFYVLQAQSLSISVKDTVSLDLYKPNHQVIHHVAVGSQGSSLFAPQRLNANIGDQIVFEFHALNHTLTQSSLEKPCASLQQFDTGFNQFNPHGRQKVVTVITVNSLEPQWFFCRQDKPTSHCHLGMVFAINPGDQMDTFFRNAERESSDDTSSVASTSKPNLHGSSSSPYSHIGATVSLAGPSHISEPIPSRSAAGTVPTNPNSSSPGPFSGSCSKPNHFSITPISSPFMSPIIVTQTATRDCAFSSKSSSPGDSPTPSRNYASFRRTISRSNMTSEGTGSAMIPSLVGPVFSALLITVFL